MPVTFKSTQHFHILESRFHNPLKGSNNIPTVHPFATMAIGFRPNAYSPFAIALTVTHPKDRFVRKIGKQRAMGLLHSANVKWFTLEQVQRGFHHIVSQFDIAHRFRQPERFVVTPVAEKTFKNVIADVQGLRFNKPIEGCFGQV
jgi:hypothetical protein